MDLWLRCNSDVDKIRIPFRQLLTAVKDSCQQDSILSIGFFIDKYLGGRMHWGVFVSIVGSAVALLAFIFTSGAGIMANFACLFMVSLCVIIRV